MVTAHRLLRLNSGNSGQSGRRRPEAEPPASGKSTRMPLSIPRRDFLKRTGAVAVVGALSGCALGTRRPSGVSQLVLAPLRISPDQISAITVCTRPFRAQGPRLEAERRGDKTVIHHYGHGGSGWSLSWDR